MALDNRNLEAGTRLVGRYKKEDHFAEVVQAEDGDIHYRLEDGREFKRLSAAAMALMGGKSCNGWRFWSLAKANGEAAEAKTGEKPKTGKARRKTARTIRPTKSQAGVAEGSVRYFCAACMDDFTVEGTEAPECCPAGHKAEPEQQAMEV